MLRTALVLILLCLASSVVLAEAYRFCPYEYCQETLSIKGNLVAATLAEKNIIAQNITDVNDLITQKTQELAGLLAKMQAINESTTATVPAVPATVAATTTQITTTTQDGEVKTLADDGTVIPTTSTNSTESLSSIKELINTLTSFLGSLKVRVQAMIDAETNPEIKLNLLNIWERIVNLEATLKLVDEKLTTEIAKTLTALSTADSERAKQLQAEINDLIKKQEDLTIQYDRLVHLMEAEGTDTTCQSLLNRQYALCCVPGPVDRKSQYKSCTPTDVPLIILCPEKPELRTQIENANTQITGYQTDIAALDTKMADEQKGIDNLNKEIVALQASIPTEEQKCSIELQGYLDEVSKLQSEVLVLQDLLAQVQNNSEIADKKPIVDLIKSIIDSFNKNAADSQAKYDAAKNRCATGIAAIKTQITAKQADIVTINESIVNEGLKKGYLNTLITKLTAQVTALTTQLNKLITLCGN